MPLILFACQGGPVTLPNRAALLLDRRDGGNLCILPPRDVWERSELSPDELTADRLTWAAEFQRLTPAECRSIVAQAVSRLEAFYGVPTSALSPWGACRNCGYPAPADTPMDTLSVECQPQDSSAVHRSA